MLRRIPLFPLGTVLFPGLVLPLHLFEPRYARLVRDLLRLPEDERLFGVVAIREGHEVGVEAARALHEVGCTALLREVTQRGPGRYDVEAVGVERFGLLEVEPVTDEDHYLTATVEILPEEGGGDDEELAEQRAAVTREFGRYRAALQGAPDPVDLAADGTGDGRDDDPDPPVPSDTPVGVLAYAVAAATILDLDDKQALLAAHDVGHRLALEERMLRRERRLIRALSALPAVDLPHEGFSAN